MTHQATRKRLLPWLMLLSAVFFLWQIIILCTIGTRYNIVDLLLKSHIKLPASVFPAELMYVIAQITLYTVFALAIWILARSAGKLCCLSWKHTRLLGFILWGMGIAAILLANQIWFPLSLFSALMYALFPSILFSEIALAILVTLLILALLATIAYNFYRIHLFLKTALIVIGMICAVLILYRSHRVIAYAPTPSAKPNIVIIGLDAMRPDYLTHAPHLTRFLAKSTHFTMALTPIARTFAAWSGILTGQYPPHNHIRFNLIDQTHLKLKNTLSAILQRQGYETIYATDDRRFSNITKHFGFNKLIGIKAGANDFILGSFNDFPLSNLIINSRVGALLFPFSFNNRAAYITYSPDAFIATLQRKLDTAHRIQPLFLCVHFCLPHWPYTWATVHEKRSATTPFLYRLAVNRVDRQFGRFMEVLARKHVLDNAIVVVISDHGEALGLPSDRMLSEKHYLPGSHSLKRTTLFSELNAIPNNKSLNVSTGHGTDILSWSQHHTLLAFRGFGNQKNASTKVTPLVSLIDIKPTLLELLDLPSPDTDGQSLAPYIQGKMPPTKPRKILVETGFTPKAIQSTSISVQDVVYQAIDFFRVDPKTTHIILKTQTAKRLLHTKQRALYYQNWVLALYPYHKKSIPILVNRITGQWTDDLHSPFAQNSPAHEMLKTLRTYYGQEIKSIL